MWYVLAIAVLGLAFFVATRPDGRHRFGSTRSGA